MYLFKRTLLAAISIAMLSSALTATIETAASAKSNLTRPHQRGPQFNRGRKRHDGFTQQQIASSFATLGISDLGAASAAKPIVVTVIMEQQNASDLTALIEAQANPSSPYYGQYVTPPQYDSYFGPTSFDVANVTSTFIANGFLPMQTTQFPAAVLKFSGTVAEAQAMFATQIDTVMQTGFGLEYTAVQPINIPDAIAPAIAGLTGLSSLNDQMQSPQYVCPQNTASPCGGCPGVDTSNVCSPIVVHTAVPSPPVALPTQPSLPTAPPLPTDKIINNCSGANAATPYQRSDGNQAGYGAPTFATDFDLPIQVGCGGSPLHSIAIIVPGAPKFSDLQTYYNRYGVQRTLPGYILKPVGSSDFTDLNEAALDVEIISSLAPKAPVYLYRASDYNAGSIVDAMYTVVHDNLVSVLNMSLGGCEFQGVPGVVDNYLALKPENEAIQQAVAQGITVVVSTGDHGLSVCDFGSTTSKGHIDAPASSAYAVAVGATSPDTENAYAAAYSSEYGAMFSGGGTSVYFKKNQDQYGVCGGSYRCTPDIALAGGGPEFDHSALIYKNGIGYVEGGTSLAAPIFSALQAETNQLDNRRHGYINDAVYNQYYRYGYGGSPTFGSVFTDIIAGNNGAYAITGWDFVTGIGVPDGVHLAQDEN